MEESSDCPCFQRRRTSTVGNYRSIDLVNNFSKVFKFFIHDNVAHFLKSKLNASQHGFIKSKSTLTNVVTSVDFVTQLVCSQDQTDSALILAVSSTLFITNPVTMDYLPLTQTGFSFIYLRDSPVYISLVHVRLHLSCCQEYPKGHFRAFAF